MSTHALRFLFVIACLALISTRARAQSLPANTLAVTLQRPVLFPSPEALRISVAKGVVAGAIETSRADHSLAGGLTGALVGGIGFAVYINNRCQRHRSDAGCGASVTLAAVEGAAVGAFVGAIIGRQL